MTGESIGRILAVDPGQRRVGLAVSDPLGVVAQGLPTFDKKRGDVFAHLRSLAAEYQLKRIVVGRPLSMSGRENEASHAADERPRGRSDGRTLPCVSSDCPADGTDGRTPRGPASHLPIAAGRGWRSRRRVHTGLLHRPAMAIGLVLLLLLRALPLRRVDVVLGDGRS
jgi:hypothetical protein